MTDPFLPGVAPFTLRETRPQHGWPLYTLSGAEAAAVADLIGQPTGKDDDGEPLLTFRADQLPTLGGRLALVGRRVEIVAA